MTGVNRLPVVTSLNTGIVGIHSKQIHRNTEEKRGYKNIDRNIETKRGYKSQEGDVSHGSMTRYLPKLCKPSPDRKISSRVLGVKGKLGTSYLLFIIACGLWKISDAEGRSDLGPNNGSSFVMPQNDIRMAK